METICTHLFEVHRVQPRTEGCEECLEAGEGWVELRLCLACGHVGCCNRSERTHALRHFLETGHSVVQSLEEGDEWAWCYRDEIFLVPQIVVHAHGPA